jgi:hypothetical protein
MTMALYLSNLEKLKPTLFEKNSKYLDFNVLLACFCNALCWTTFAYIRHDVYVAIPNVVGIFSNLALILVYLWAEGQIPDKVFRWLVPESAGEAISESTKLIK